MWFNKEAKDNDPELKKRILELLKKLDEKCQDEFEG